MTFHFYGFLIGLAIVGMGLLGDKVFQVFVKKTSDQQIFLPAFWLSLLGALIGSRFWHVVTSWSIYKNNWSAIFNLPNGGLSILGALVGGLGVAFLFFKFSKKLNLWPVYLDTLAFVLPLAQSLGRLGNFANQELCGYPSKVWWAIPISYEYRPKGFTDYSHFHPLFLYEILALLIFTVGLWWLYYRKDQPLIKKQIGKGKIFLFYLIYYLFLRFFLDFIRIDKTLIPVSDLYLGLNQLVIFLVMSVLTWPMFKFFGKKIKIYFLVLLVMVIAIIFSQQFSWRKLSQAKINYLLVDQSQTSIAYQQLKKVPDHSQQTIRLGEQLLTVEVVNTPASITQGLSGREQIGVDGMLFVLPQKVQTEFWMKEMKFDLDLLWLVDDQLVEISQDAVKPDPKTPLSLLPRYRPSQKVEMVLELEADQSFFSSAEKQKLELIKF